MTDPLPGNEGRAVSIAIIGSGPSGFYAAEALLSKDDRTHVDMFDRLPTPFGLVRGGVAPDHEKIKGVAKHYTRTAKNSRFRFFGNVMLGRDIEVADLVARYDQIVYAVGNESDRRLGIEGENLPGVASATSFVGWYNGHPDYVDARFDLANARRVAVIGNGNVAVDVARILIRDPAELATTDIAAAALEELRQSQVQEVVLLGRRGPVQAAFTPREIAELTKLDGVDVVVPAEAMELDPASAAWYVSASDADRKGVEKNLAVLQGQVPLGDGEHERKLRLLFCVSPTEIIGSDDGLTGIRLERNRLDAHNGGIRSSGTGEFFEIEVDRVFEAIGYRGVKIDGVPFDERSHIIPNQEGRVLVASGSDEVVPNQYVVGWAKRGPSGLIGTNKGDSEATVAKMLEDVSALRDAASKWDGTATDRFLRSRGIDFVTFADWELLDRFEQARGEEVGKPREKVVTVEEMLQVIRAARKSDHESDGDGGSASATDGA